MPDEFDPPPIWFRNEREWDLWVPLHEASYLVSVLNHHDSEEMKRVILSKFQITDAGKTQGSEDYDELEADSEDDDELEANEEAVGLVSDATKKQRARRGAKKGLAMELGSAAILQQVDQPVSVTAWCRLLDGKPNGTAGRGLADIIARYPESGTTPEFMIVAEVSAKKEVSHKDYLDQLVGALTHANNEREKDPQTRIYCLLVNNGKIHVNKGLHRLFLDFVENNSLRADGPIRMVPMYSQDFATLSGAMAQTLESTYFDSHTLASALDAVCLAIHEPTLPEEETWMIKTFKDAFLANLSYHDSGLGRRPESISGHVNGLFRPEPR